MNDRIRTRLVDALESADAIHGWSKKYSFEEISSNLLIESAFVRQFEIIGEALRVVRDIDPYFNSMLPEIDQWVGLRHRLIHDYREIDLNLLWSSSVTAIPVLIQQLEALLET